MKRVERKGVSPIVAVAILVLIAVAAGVLLWLWVSGFTSAATAQQPALYERIKIEGVTANKTDGTWDVKAYVRNVGSVAVTINATYVLDANGVVIAHGPANMPIDPGKVGQVDITVTLTSGRPYIVKVATKNGVEASYIFVAP